MVPQDVLAVVAKEGDSFDAVCMATALHKMGQLNAGERHYLQLATRPEFQRLLCIIRAPCCRLNLRFT